jgi:predicted alpha/beta hydrolase family esterase
MVSVARTLEPELGPHVERWMMVDERGDTFTGLWRGALPHKVAEAECGVADRPWTAVLLGGFRSGDRAALLLPETLHVHILAIDWPWKGPRNLNAVQFLSSLPAIRRAALRSPAALALGVDAVSRQPEVDATRIAIVGASLGVPITIASLELTSVPAACALIYGGADIKAWMSHALAHHGTPARLAALVARLAFTFVRPLEPALHKAAAAKLRLLIMNARNDQFVPPAVAEALHRAFPEALVRWKEGRHLGGGSSRMIDDLAAEIEVWLGSSTCTETPHT